MCKRVGVWLLTVSALPRDGLQLVGAEARLQAPHGGGDPGHGVPGAVLLLLQHAGGRAEAQGESTTHYTVMTCYNMLTTF